MSFQETDDRDNYFVSVLYILFSLQFANKLQ